MKKLIAAVLLCLPMQVFALSVAGVDVPEKAHVDSRDLVLNGAGIRTKFLFKIYVGALYLEGKKTTADAVLVDSGAKRVALHIMRHLNGGDLMEAFNKAINANHTPEEYAPLAVRLIQFSRVFREVGEVKKGDVITLDYLPSAGTVVSVNGKEHGRIEGEDFYRALLKIWMGKKPVSEDLKKGMLGG
jgi:hypothetical protein